MITYAYKLVRLRKDGTLGPLFINRKLRIPFLKWLPAEDHKTKGYAHRPGWHATAEPIAPHLSKKGRAWCKVALQGVRADHRPVNQGGVWYIADRIKFLSLLRV